MLFTSGVSRKAWNRESYLISLSSSGSCHLLFKYPPMSLKVAAIVPCYNRREKTLRFLEIFTQQILTQPADRLQVEQDDPHPHRSQNRSQIFCQVILVDAQSTDGTTAAVRELFPQVQILSAHSESYWTASINRGIEVALQQDYDYILTINDDAIVEPDYLANLVRTAQQAQVPVLASRIDYQARPGLIWAMGTELSWGIRLLHLKCRNLLVRELPLEVRSQPVLDVEAAPGDGVLIHRSVFEQIGLYAERWMPHYHADSEFLIRANRAGFRVCVAPQVVLYDDSPLPTHSSDLRPIASFLPDFWFTFFTKKSSWFLLPRIYLVLRYCPWYRQPIVLLQTTIVAMLGWIAKRQIQRIAHSFRMMSGKVRAVADAK